MPLHVVFTFWQETSLERDRGPRETLQGSNIKSATTSTRVLAGHHGCLFIHMGNMSMSFYIIEQSIPTLPSPEVSSRTLVPACNTSVEKAVARHDGKQLGELHCFAPVRR